MRRREGNPRDDRWPLGHADFDKFLDALVDDFVVVTPARPRLPRLGSASSALVLLDSERGVEQANFPCLVDHSLPHALGLFVVEPATSLMICVSLI